MPEVPKNPPKDKDRSKLVDDLINGNYFTYFVDLNAEETGNIFFNAPNNPYQTPEEPKEEKNTPTRSKGRN